VRNPPAIVLSVSVVTNRGVGTDSP
jgi:hypothetical protein